MSTTTTTTATTTTTTMSTAIPHTPPPSQVPESDYHNEPITPLPRRPNPSSDPYLRAPPTTPSSPAHAGRHEDLFNLPPTEALRLLSVSIESLVRITGDIPPTPPPKSPHTPNMRGMEAEKAGLVRSHSEKNLARLRVQAEREAAEKDRPTTSDPTAEGLGLRMEAQAPAPAPDAAPTSPACASPPSSFNTSFAGFAPVIDGVKLRSTPCTSPTSPTDSRQLEPYIVIGADSQPLNLQHSAITRKFYSKNEPPISIARYLQRLHQYCPMSTAVYLATSLYIHRLAVEERAIPVTRRNAHRLLLAGLRVAMKALEDLSYPHAKMAKVGGVSEIELARLEISFCFLAGFELVVGEEKLRSHWLALRRSRENQVGVGGSAADLPPLRIRRKERRREDS